MDWIGWELSNLQTLSVRSAHSCLLHNRKLRHSLLIAKEAMAKGAYTPATPYLENALKTFKDLAINIESFVHQLPTPDIKGLYIPDLPIDIIEVGVWGVLRYHYYIWIKHI